MTAASSPGQDQAQSLQQPSVTVKPVDLALTITPGPTSEAEPSPSQQEASAQSAGSPAQLEPLLVQQETLDQPPAPSGNEPFPVQLEPPTHPPETSTAATGQPPIHNEVTFSPAGPGEAQHPVMPSTTGPSLCLHLQSPLGRLTLFQANKRPQLRLQPPEPPKEVEMTVGTPGQNQAQHSSSPSVTDKPLDLGLTVTPGPLTAAGHSASLQQTSHPTYTEVTPPQAEQVLAQHPAMTEFILWIWNLH
ncbi:leucine-rich repeat-containing protein 37A3-like [Vicugna pacos]|uniref:Leucine-rich repeat-containing protein 37A3-like n=1 Tax=Vicugna pacos TaxID=30538 RepID=A0ABM5BIJ6_VICPA